MPILFVSFDHPHPRTVLCGSAAERSEWAHGTPCSCPAPQSSDWGGSLGSGRPRPNAAALTCLQPTAGGGGGGETWPAATATGEECVQMSTRGGRTRKLSGNGETQPETSRTHFTPARTAGPTKPAGTSVGRRWKNRNPYTAGGGVKRGSVLGKQSQSPHNPDSTARRPPGAMETHVHSSQRWTQPKCPAADDG